MKIKQSDIIYIINNEDELSNAPQDKIMEHLHTISQRCNAQMLMSLMRHTVRITKQNILNKINELDEDS